MPIPPFDHNLVIPPHLGNPANPNEVSPYPCTSLELCQHFATTRQRKEILINFITFRQVVRRHNLLNGLQWLDGSFLEDIEQLQNRPPRDLDVVTIYWGYNLAFQQSLVNHFPEFADPSLSKANFKLDHYPFDASMEPFLVVEYSRYWTQLFSHNRNSIWKGMLAVDLNTDAVDTAALQYLNSLAI